MVGKGEQIHTLNFFLVLTFLSTGSNSPFWSAPRIWSTWTFVSLHLRRWCSADVFTSSLLTVNSRKATRRPFTSASPCFCTCVQKLRTSSFPELFIMTTSVSAWLFGDCFIYSVIHLFIYSSFYEPFNYVTIFPNTNDLCTIFILILIIRIQLKIFNTSFLIKITIF